MFGLLRAGGFAAALTLFASVIATPAMASEAATAAPMAGANVTAVSAVVLPAPVAAPQEVQPALIQMPSAPAAASAASPAQRPLRDLILSFVDYGNQDEQQLCLATAVYFEARGEALEGQLAVAEVVLNRAASGVYPPTICDVVTQPAQFSFVRGGRFPKIDKSSSHWRTALAIADVARKGLADKVAPNVLWYHASYVSPGWGRRLTRVAQIGTHIFYS